MSESLPENAAPDEPILEGIVVTLDVAGVPNIAPMGPRVDRDLTRLVLRPFQTSQTYRNLKATGCGVFHVTDDVELLAHAAVGQLEPLAARWFRSPAFPARAWPMPAAGWLFRSRRSTIRPSAQRLSAASSAAANCGHFSASIGPSTPSSKRPFWPRAIGILSSDGNPPRNGAADHSRPKNRRARKSAMPSTFCKRTFPLDF